MSNSNKILRYVFLFATLFFVAIYLIAWLAVGIPLRKYYNRCLNKSNYFVVERSVSYNESEISFEKIRTITGSDNADYVLSEKCKSILNVNRFYREVKHGDIVLLKVVPLDDAKNYTIISLQKDDKTYLNFEDGYNHLIAEQRLDLDYFYSGTLAILFLLVLAFLLFLIFQIKCMKSKSKHKNNLNKTYELKTQNISKQETIKVLPLVLIAFFGMLCLIETAVFGFAWLKYSKYSSRKSYKEAACQIIDNNGFRDLEIVYESPQNGVRFSILKESEEIALNNDFYDETQVGDIVMITYIRGDYHGTPLYIAEIKTDSKVYLSFDEGFSILSDWQKVSYSLYYAFFIPTLSIFLICVTISIPLYIKKWRAKKERSD